MALEEFVKTGSVPAGELVMRLPGTDFKTLYSGGEAYVSSSGRMGYVALKPTDLEAVANGEVKGLMGELGVQMREALNVPGIKPRIDAFFADTELYLFISKTAEGDVITLQGFNDGEGVIGDTNIISYEISGQMPLFEEVYAMHVKGLRGKQVIATDLDAVQQLPARANDLYDQALVLMTGFGF